MVNGYAARWLAKGFAWVHPKEVTGPRPAPSADPVRVVGPDGRLLGVGIADTGWLAVRMFRHDDGPLDDALLERRLDVALRLRRAVVPPDTTAWRAVHGENDGLPGIRVDIWNRHASFILDSPSLAPLAERLAPLLADRVPLDGAYLCYRPDPRDDRDVARWTPAPGLLWGEAAPEEIEVVECGVKLGARLAEGPDVGVYADMRGVRQWMQPFWPGRRVLNTFAYTGAFSVAAAVHGATRVVSVDLSNPSLARLRHNLERNGLEPVDDDIVGDDTFKALDRYRRKGDRFDVVVLDPPSFSHGPAGTWSVTKDFPRLVASAARVLDPGGWIVAASNHGQTSPKVFRGWVADGIAKAGRVGNEIAWLSASPDFPSAIAFPEGHYLKVGVWALD